VTMGDYQETYSRMSDDQLLNLAQEADSLTALAKIALESELATRRLGPQEIAEQAEHLRKVAQEKPLAQTFNGFGTKIYGKRDFEPNGSFVTTKWVVFFWIPFIPLRSFRVRNVGPGETRMSFGWFRLLVRTEHPPHLRPAVSIYALMPISFGWFRRYLVQTEHPPHCRQAITVYSFMLSFFVGVWLLDSIQAGPLGACGALALWASTPWCLRWRARRNVDRSRIEQQ
jgi:hypothetical protein